MGMFENQTWSRRLLRLGAGGFVGKERGKGGKPGGRPGGWLIAFVKVIYLWRINAIVVNVLLLHLRGVLLLRGLLLETRHGRVMGVQSHSSHVDHAVTVTSLM